MLEDVLDEVLEDVLDELESSSPPPLHTTMAVSSVSGSV